MLLCSASRDRLIHIFDPRQQYSLVQTVADHSGSVFAARIIETDDDGEIRLVSCGTDKSLLIRVLEVCVCVCVRGAVPHGYYCERGRITHTHTHV